jgi:hypothetical protein
MKKNILLDIIDNKNLKYFFILYYKIKYNIQNDE